MQISLDCRIIVSNDSTGGICMLFCGGRGKTQYRVNSEEWPDIVYSGDVT